MQGLHLIADLYRCDCDPAVLLDRNVLESRCVDFCKDAGLTPLGAYFYQFCYDDGDPAGVTGTVVLAESHVAIHTWPETRAVTLDVYVCNFSRDNSDRARHVYAQLQQLLKPEEVIEKDIIRGELPESA
ncbi:adenosylmethionine decarboxylase [Denitromonas iodatirespirans]|uniref:Adenosylmethionine decarboxylase n=1 Tax=Denitromonas iodatirespirans TaxID=2795389 RepID=A0A944D7W6_DENI1|nr:adenosylmethionine decarboxylase [Denitromonas iodatirespirans]MBT0959961.1 adenosylmethionine decarboxylase [Denitromonas iodatirespirans]